MTAGVEVNAIHGAKVFHPPVVPGYFGDATDARRAGSIPLRDHFNPEADDQRKLEAALREKVWAEAQHNATFVAKAYPPPALTPAEFVAWMRGFFAGRSANPADPKLEQLLRDTLERVK